MADRILVIEDDEQVATMLCDILRDGGYEPIHCATGAAGVREAITAQPALVMLDLGLEEGYDGLAVCRQLREIPAVRDVPIVVLTGAGGPQIEASLFEAGADDFLRKGEIRADVLMHRIAAVLRRSQATQAVTLSAGELQADLVSRQATVAGTSLDLPPAQFKILAHLMRCPGELVTGEALAAEEGGAASTLRVHVLGLRRKLGDREWMIQTVRGQGYRLRLERDG